MIAETGLGPEVTRVEVEDASIMATIKNVLFILITGSAYGGAVVNMVASNVEGCGGLGLLTLFMFL